MLIYQTQPIYRIGVVYQVNATNEIKKTRLLRSFGASLSFHPLARTTEMKGVTLIDKSLC